MNNVSSENEINKRERFFNLIRNMLLLHHTTAKSNYDVMIFTLIAFERTYIAEHPVLSMFPDSAGIKDNQLSLKPVVCKIITHKLKHTFNFFTVSHILLAAVSNNASFRFFIIRC